MRDAIINADSQRASLRMFALAHLFAAARAVGQTRGTAAIVAGSGRRRRRCCAGEHLFVINVSRPASPSHSAAAEWRERRACLRSRVWAYLIFIFKYISTIVRAPAGTRTQRRVSRHAQTQVRVRGRSTAAAAATAASRERASSPKRLRTQRRTERAQTRNATPS